MDKDVKEALYSNHTVSVAIVNILDEHEKLIEKLFKELETLKVKLVMQQVEIDNLNNKG